MSHRPAFAPLCAVFLGFVSVLCCANPDGSAPVQRSPPVKSESSGPRRVVGSVPSASAVADAETAELSSLARSLSGADIRDVAEAPRRTGTLPRQSGARPPATGVRAPRRLVAFGDVHGDMVALRSALRIAGAVGGDGRWSGGKLVVVQTGDQIDRGPQDREVLDYLAKVVVQAERAGGALYLLNGNHEIMNVVGDLRYVARGAFAAFENVPGIDSEGAAVRHLPEFARARQAAFLPGGPYARMLATRNIVMIVGDSVFVHGGVLPQFADGIVQLNQQTRAWLSGESKQQPAALMDPEGPLWSRHYSDRTSPAGCRLLSEALLRLGAQRMVVGHTPQARGITSACQDKVWRVDVGMSAHYGGTVQVLEIEGDRVRVIKSSSRGSDPRADPRADPRGDPRSTPAIAG